MHKSWLAVVSANHAYRGRDGGFIQVCHGKSTPLRRMKPQDRIVIYAPAEMMGGKDKLQSFVTFGTIHDDCVFPFDMGGGFVPFRRRVDYVFEARPAPILPLLQKLELTRNIKNWGYQFRFGLLPICEADMDIIAEAMTIKKAAELPPPPSNQFELWLSDAPKQPAAARPQYL